MGDSLPSSYGRRFDSDVNHRPEGASFLPHLSQAVITFLAERGTSAEDIALMPVNATPEFDDTHPLTDYFVSTSHNTYLLGNQLWGKACPTAYSNVISNGAHCVEIDVWPQKDGDKGLIGPVVTHGLTLTEHVPFLKVCSAIRDAFDARTDNLPLFVSLECHVPLEGQQEVVDIMNDCWEHRLASNPGDGARRDNLVTVKDLRGKIVLMVEYYPPANPGEIAEELEELDLQDKEKDPNPCHKISDTLAVLGFYSRSMKPAKDWLTKDIPNPLNVLINISESALSKVISDQQVSVVDNARKYLRRVYPRGSRVSSGNLNPVKFWRAGSHFTALNWQEFDMGMQLNEAMFSNTGGWVLKPIFLRGVSNAETKRIRLAIDVVGLSALQHPKKDNDYSLQIRIHVLHRDGDYRWKSKHVKCKDIPESGLDIMINEQFSYEFVEDSLSFIRILATHDKYINDEHLGIFCARLCYVQEGWRFVRLLDDNGKDSHATLLVKFTIEDVYDG